MSELILYEYRKEVVWLTINRPERLNALNIPLLDELIIALEKVEADKKARTVVITGAGTKAFCAGADIDSFYSESTGISEHTFREKLLRLFELLMQLSKPTIARVNGYALGGGFGLAMGCDLVVCASSARFGTPEINIGLFPMMIMPVLYRNIGRKRLLEMMYTGEKISGEEAERLGMVNHAVSVDQLDQKILEITDKLAQKSGMTLKLGRQAFHQMADMALPEALDYLKDMLSANLHTTDAAEGLKAFLEKRKPHWQHE